MDNIFNYIKNIKNEKSENIAYLKESSLPLFLYGAGSYAVDVMKFLTKHGIHISGLFVDNEYHKQTTLKGYEIFKFSDMRQKQEKFNVVITNSSFINNDVKNRLANIEESMFIDAPNEDVFFDFDFLKCNEETFNETFNSLSDQLSKDVFVAFINAKLSGNPIPLYNTNVESESQYFSNLVDIKAINVFLQAGGFDGQTVLDFTNRNNNYKQIITFEPDKENLELLRNNCKGVKNLEVVDKGLYNQNTILYFEQNTTGTSKIVDSGEMSIGVTTIDSVISRMSENNKVYITLDIEGAELQALYGSRETIENNTTYMAISVYHKSTDLIEIPRFINNLKEDYDIYLRHYGYNTWETIMYAIPKRG